MLYKYLKRFGVLKVTIAISIASIFFSNLIAVLFDTVSLIGNIQFPSRFISTITPAIVAPVLIYVILRLVVEVNVAEEKLLALSITDELTGIYNRRWFVDIAEHQHAKAHRYGETFSVALLDVDDFKKINDAYGHLIGDKALMQVAKICKENIRLPDICARYGGDEFIFLFPSTGKENARMCLERISGEISNNPIQHDGYIINILVSIGIAEFSNKSLILNDVLREADMALYEAKRAGKNKVVLSTKTDC
jgi:diguanylate cyclase (GGDEF)-like protein